MPTSSEPTKPGPCVTAMAARSPSWVDDSFQRQADGGDDGAQMLARGELRDYAAVLRMRRHLRRDDGGKNARAVLDHGGRGFVARRFYAEYFHAIH